MHRTAYKLTYREGKPDVFKLRQLTFPPIKKDHLVEYIANSANVSVSTIEAAIAGIIEAIIYFVVNGHRVVFDKFGGFYLGVLTGVSRSFEECTVTDNIKKCRLKFAPVTEMRELITDTGTMIMGSSQYLTPESEGGGDDDDDDGD